MYGVTYEHLRFLNVRFWGRVASDTAVRNRVDRLEDMGLITRRAVLGKTWVSLTGRGASAIEETWVPWSVPATRVSHGDELNRLRLWYEADSSRQERTGVWVSERELYRERARVQGHWHISDAELRLPGAPIVTAVEVELHRKTPRQRYVDEVFAKLRPEVVAVVYFCPPELCSSIEASVSWAAKQTMFGRRGSVDVVALPRLTPESFVPPRCSS